MTIAAPLLRLDDVAAICHVSSRTIQRWTEAARFPAPIKLSPRTIRWDAQDVQWWIARQRGRVGSEVMP